MIKDYVPARIEIELFGVRAYLEGHGRGSIEDCDLWECEDPGIKKILDAETGWCMVVERSISHPPSVLVTDWAIEAGRVVVERLKDMGAKIISIRPMRCTPNTEPPSPNVIV